MIIIQPTPFRKQMVGKLIEYEFLDERSNFKIWFGLWWSNPKVGSNRIKGELKRLSFNRQFSPKSLKVGQKSGQRVQNWPNKNQVASDLLRASSNSVIGATEGIHQFCHQTHWGNPFEPTSCAMSKIEEEKTVLELNAGILVERESGSTSPHRRNHGVSS